MIEFEVVTLFPELFDSVLRASLLGKAIAAGIVRVHFTSPRDFAPGKHRQVDDTPYGGGVGMVMKPDPLVSAIESAVAARGPAHRVLLSPAGRPLDQARVRALAQRPRILLVCGRYEGIDERVCSHVDEEITVGDYVLTGGELPALIVIDAVSRLVPGVLGKGESADEESFSEGLLEYPHYTRPPEFRGAAIPAVLAGGNHEAIRLWRRRQRLLRTRERRPDLFARMTLSAEDAALLAHVEEDN
jgi:tRNA (guanine37-N1)-methyltransferase